MQTLKNNGSGQASVPASNIRKLAVTIRKTSLQMVHRSKLGHPGGDMSAADILAVLYSTILRMNPAEPSDPLRDRFVMSKGHCSAALYATLAEFGFFPRE